MYPRLSDMINDLLGTSIRLPIQTYGFFVALAFVVGAFILYLELKRKEKQGILSPVNKSITKGTIMKVYQSRAEELIHNLRGALVEYV